MRIRLWSSSIIVNPFHVHFFVASYESHETGVYRLNEIAF